MTIPIKSISAACQDQIILKGEYLITDPCYVYDADDDRQWDTFCGLLWHNEVVKAGVPIEEPKFPEFPSDSATLEENIAWCEEFKEVQDKLRCRNENIAKVRRSMVTTFHINGEPVYVMSTAYGDGRYPVFELGSGYRTGSICVDSGLFAIIPIGNSPSDSDLGRVPGVIVRLDGELSHARGNTYVNNQLIVDTNGELDDDDEW